MNTVKCPGEFSIEYIIGIFCSVCLVFERGIDNIYAFLLNII